jgi:hypothetical protein
MHKDPGNLMHMLNNDFQSPLILRVRNNDIKISAGCSKYTQWKG